MPYVSLRTARREIVNELRQTVIETLTPRLVG